MKESVFAAAVAVLLCLAFLVLIGLLAAAPPESDRVIQIERRVPVSDEPATAASDTPEAVPVISPRTASFDRRFRLPVLQQGTVVSMSLHDYVLGALLGEMPTSFHPQALRAQAIACRTYALRRYETRRHDPAAVCTDPGCCMNWTDPAVYEAQNGADALALAEAAVEETDGLAIYYGERLIDATFFSCSGGRTEDAAAVWGSEVPYLVAVDSPDEHAPHDTDTVEYGVEEWKAVLLSANEMADFDSDSSTWIGPAVRTNGGGVSEIELGGCIYTGVQLRKLFGLRSTMFTMELCGDAVRITTHGYGHRVGLSQYGANAMAEAGADATQILQHYYTGVEILSADQTGR